MTMNFPDMRSDIGVTLDAVRPSKGGRARLRQGRQSIYRRRIKRALDVTLILLSLPVALPLIAILALWVACDGGNPFYTQVRVGKGGRTFRLWKLRSMVHDADARLEAHLATHPAAREEWRRTQKLKSDPRITRSGRLLRRTSLDELPQLWNVLTGEMSLVGPRPMMVSQQPLYPGSAYYTMRPGITGYWQVSGRNDTTFEARALYDAAYQADLSLGTDMRILYRTVGVVLGATGY